MRAGIAWPTKLRSHRWRIYWPFSRNHVRTLFRVSESLTYGTFEGGGRQRVFLAADPFHFGDEGVGVQFGRRSQPQVRLVDRVFHAEPVEDCAARGAIRARKIPRRGFAAKPRVVRRSRTTLGPSTRQRPPTLKGLRSMPDRALIELGALDIMRPTQIPGRVL